MVCNDECESVRVLMCCGVVRHILILGIVLWKRFHFYISIQNYLLSFNGLEKTSFVLGSELWEGTFCALLTLVKR